MIADLLCERAFVRCCLAQARRSELYAAEESLIADPDLRILFNAVRQFVIQFNGVPTQDVLWTHLQTQTPENRARAWQAYGEVLALQGVEPQNFDFYLHRLENLRTGRLLLEAGNAIKKTVGENGDFELCRSELTGKLLRAAPGGTILWRGFVAEDARARWEEYKQIESGLAVTEACPYGINFLDRETGGIWPETLILFYGRSGAGKSRTMISVGYNVCQHDEPVLYLSLEMSHRLLKRCFDARCAMIDSTQIRVGALGDARELFRTALQDQIKKNPPFYIVDMPSSGVRVSDLYREIELFQARVGCKPKLCLVDYAGLMRPHEKWGNPSEKYQLLFEELHGFARATRVGTVTAMIESRKSSEAKGTKGEGMEMVGLSNYVIPNVDVAIQLKAEKEHVISGHVKAIIVKNRDDRAGLSDLLTVRAESSYVGDPRLDLGARAFGMKR